MSDENKSPILVGVVMGSDSDTVTMSKVRGILDKFGIPYAGMICSAHRTPEDVPATIQSWVARGCKVFIAGAGWAAHLAGAFAANTTLPVIGVPLASSKLSGLDALLATVQMPAGIPVATIAIDCPENAAYFAIQILATSDADLSAKLVEHRVTMAEGVREKSRKLIELQGWPG